MTHLNPYSRIFVVSNFSFLDRTPRLFDLPRSPKRRGTHQPQIAQHPSFSLRTFSAIARRHRLWRWRGRRRFWPSDILRGRERTELPA